MRCIRDRGITPAYAGNTDFILTDKDVHKDHPRLRGEHIEYTFKSMILQGSPPPTRGTQLLIQQLQHIYGITPAYAGNTMLVNMGI